ncbi:MAG: hypothetical protein ABFE08_04620 [Armatimonadia bacterium]
MTDGTVGDETRLEIPPTAEEVALEQEFVRLSDQAALDLRLGRIAAAWTTTQKLLEGWPESTSAQELAGDVAAAQGKVALARQHYQAAMRLEPANVDAERKYAMALVTQTPEERRQALLAGVIANPSARTGEGRKPLNAVLNALLFPGMGQLYNKEQEKGLAMIGAAALSLICLLYVLMPYFSAQVTIRRADSSMRTRVEGAQEVINGMGAGSWLLVALAIAVYVGLYLWGIYDAWQQSQSEDDILLGVR